MAEVVPDEVQAAEGIRGFAHDPSRVGIFPEVGDDALGLAAVGRDLLNDRMHAGLVDVDHGDARTLAESLLKPLYMAAKQA